MKKNAEETRVINAVVLENKNFKKVKEGIEKTISDFTYSKAHFHMI